MSFEQDYGIEAVTSTVRRFANNMHNRVFTAEFEGGDRTILPMGDSFTWDEVRYSRDLAPLVNPTDEGPRKKRIVVRKRHGGFLDVKVSVELPPEFLHFMRAPGEMGANARKKIDDELEDGGIQLGNTVEYCCYLAFTGTLDPAAVPNSQLNSDAISFPVQLLSRTNSWADPNTLIRSGEMPVIKDTFYKKANIDTVRAITTRTVEGYITSNADLINLASENPLLAAQLLGRSFVEGGGIQHMGGVDFKFQRSHYASDATPDTTVDFMNSEYIFFLPPEAERKNMFAMVDGLTAIPTGPVFGSIDSAMNAVTLVRGYYAYWELKGTTLVLHMGRRFMPVIKMVNGVMRFKTVNA